MKRVLIIYGLISTVFAIGIVGILYYGDTIFGGAGASQAVAETSPWSALEQNLSEPLGRLLLQVIAIVIATRLVGLPFAKLGQPTVIGEITAGILLGPSPAGLDLARRLSVSLRQALPRRLATVRADRRLRFHVRDRA